MLNTIHDSFFKSLFSVRENLQDLLQGTLPPEILNRAKHIHLQLLRYILNVWEEQAENKQELTPVICIVFYHGKLKWIHRHILQTVAEELRRFVPMFDYVLFDTKDFDDHAIIQRFKTPDVKIGVWFLKRSYNLIDFIRNNPALAREIFKEINYIEKNKYSKNCVLFI